MTDAELVEIEARANAAFERGHGCRSINLDIPTLIAEVRRLRELVSSSERADSQINEALNTGDGVYRP